MPTRRPTITDVAEHAGVSPATVSLVVRDSPQIPGVTKERVRVSMEALGYVYNRRAAEMRAKRSRILGLIVTNVRNPYFAELTMAVEEAAGRAGYTVLLGCSDDDPTRELRLLSVMAEHQVDGVILLPSSQGSPTEVAGRSAMERLSHVCVARAIPGHSSNYVGADNLASGMQLGEHLTAIGVRSVAFLGGVHDTGARVDRVAGLLAGLRLENVGQLHADLAAPRDADVDLSGLVEPMLRAGMPDAVVAYNDMHARALYSALRARGIEPGRDVAIGSFDDVPEARHFFPPLTSVAGHPARVGTVATERLLAVIEHQESEPESVLLEPELMVRESTLTWARSHRVLGG